MGTSLTVVYTRQHRACGHNTYRHVCMEWVVVGTSALAPFCGGCGIARNGRLMYMPVVTFALSVNTKNVVRSLLCKKSGERFLISFSQR